MVVENNCVPSEVSSQPQGGHEAKKFLRKTWRCCLAFCLSPVGLYIFFGGCTTILNIILFLICFHIFDFFGWLSNALAWWPSVVFAWWTNRVWVFHAQQGLGAQRLWKELMAFTGSRISTGIMDVTLVWLTVDVAQLNELAMKIVVGIVVVILNYLISKCLIFRNHKEVL